MLGMARVISRGTVLLPDTPFRGSRQATGSGMPSSGKGCTSLAAAMPRDTKPMHRLGVSLEALARYGCL